MFRLKDLTAMLRASTNCDTINLIIYDHNGQEIDYENGDFWINKIVDKLGFEKSEDLQIKFVINIYLSDKSGEETFIRKFIKFNELEECLINQDVICVPLEWDPKKMRFNNLEDLTDEELNIYSAIAINPVFDDDTDELLILGIELSNNIQIIHIPNFK